MTTSALCRKGVGRVNGSRVLREGALVVAVSAFHLFSAEADGEREVSRPVDVLGLALLLLGPMSLPLRHRAPLLVIAVGVLAGVVYFPLGYPGAAIFASVGVAIVSMRRRQVAEQRQGLDADRDRRATQQRLAIACDLHDLLAHSLSVDAAALAWTDDPPRAKTFSMSGLSCSSRSARADRGWVRAAETVLEAIGRPASIRTLQIGSTPNRSLCCSTNVSSAAVEGRAPSRRKAEAVFKISFRPAQLAVLPLQLGDALPVFGRHAGALSAVDLGLVHPDAQRLRVDAELLADSSQRARALPGPLTRLEHHPHGPLTQLVGVLLRCPLSRGFSASTRPGAVHSPSMQWWL